MSMRGAAAQVASKMMLDPKGARQLEVAEAMRRDPEWKWLTDAFGQPFGGWTPGQLAYLYRLYEFWTMGELAVTRLPVGCGPYADKMRDANQAALNALALIDGPEITTWVDPSQTLSPDGDGWLSWSKEITLGIRAEDGSDAWAHVDPLGSDQGVSLEIGYTDTSTTYMHLVQGTGLARWAYGSEDVVLMVPSTFVREAELYDNPSVRWKPKRMGRPLDTLAS